MRLNHLILSDLHFPYHSPAYVRSILRAWKGAVIRNLHLLGDMYDLKGFSKFEIHPAEITATSTNIMGGRKYLEDLIAALQPDRCYFYIGNHERRLIRYIIRHAPALCSTVDYSILLPARTTLVDHPWGLSLKHLSCRILHGDHHRNLPGASSMIYLNSFRSNVIMGHTHRLSHIYWDGLWAIESGHLADITALDYLKAPPNWTAGYTIIERNKPQIISLQ